MNELQLKLDLFRIKLARMRERAIQAVAWHLPRELVKWCAVRVMAHATVGPYSNQVVGDLKAMDALNRWDR